MERLFELMRFRDWGLLFLRLSLAAIFSVSSWHRIERILRPSGEMMRTSLPGWISGYLTVAEPVSALLLLFGFLTPIASLLVIIIMLGAIYYKIFVWHVGFSAPNGWSLDLLILAASLTMLFVGPGKFSLDHAMFKVR